MLPQPEFPSTLTGGVILNEKGRVLSEEDHQPLSGQYTAGWIKRGPSGVIGTNKADAIETAECMLEDAKAGLTLSPKHTSREELEQFLHHMQPDYFSYQHWETLDSLEISKGESQSRPRVKFTDVDSMKNAAH